MWYENNPIYQLFGEVLKLGEQPDLGSLHTHRRGSMIQLRGITKDNWEACTALRPADEQQRFVAPNVYSIAEAQFLDGFHSMAVYLDQMIIGYTLYGLDSDDHNYWIYRLMIDQQHQGQGYGLAAVQQVLERISNTEDRTDLVRIGYHPENERAKNLYSKAGFVEDGIAPWGELLASYTF